MYIYIYIYVHIYVYIYAYTYMTGGANRVGDVRGVGPRLEGACEEREVARVEEVEEEGEESVVRRACDAPQVSRHA